MSITIKNGQFVDESGKVVKPEFGNREQILAIKKEEERQKAIENGIEVETDIDVMYTMSARFKCKCGCEVWAEEQDEDEDSLTPFLFTARTATCFKCKTKYGFTLNKEQELIAIVKK